MPRDLFFVICVWLVGLVFFFCHGAGRADSALKQTAQSGFFVVESDGAADMWVKRITEALEQQQQQLQH
jgi:hypothetical protein